MSDNSYPCTRQAAESFHKIGYTILDKINFGSFSSVHKAIYNNKDIAVKIIDLKKTSIDYRHKFLPRELYTLKKLSHPHIVNIFDIFIINFKIFIFMDLAEKGDILDYVKLNGEMPEPKAKCWFKQISSALYFVHLNGICHRDLKAENILLDKNLNTKLTDFGFSRIVYDPTTGHRVLSETFCGSCAYASPEVLRGQPYNPILSDVWGLGVVLYVIVNNSLPFDDSDLNRMIRKQNSKKWTFSTKVINKLSNEVKELIQLMLEPDVHKRITTAKILKHSWLADAKDTIQEVESTGFN